MRLLDALFKELQCRVEVTRGQAVGRLAWLQDAAVRGGGLKLQRAPPVNYRARRDPADVTRDAAMGGGAATRWGGQRSSSSIGGGGGGRAAGGGGGYDGSYGSDDSDWHVVDGGSGGVGGVGVGGAGSGASSSLGEDEVLAGYAARKRVRQAKSIWSGEQARMPSVEALNDSLRGVSIAPDAQRRAGAGGASIAEGERQFHDAAAIATFEEHLTMLHPWIDEGWLDRPHEPSAASAAARIAARRSAAAPPAAARPRRRRTTTACTVRSTAVCTTSCRSRAPRRARTTSGRSRRACRPSSSTCARARARAATAARAGGAAARAPQPRRAADPSAVCEAAR